MKYIYRITNTKTNQVYIGSSSVLPMNRWAEHARMLKVGKAVSSRFQTSWNKHHITDWTFQVIRSIDDATPGELLRIEASFITEVPEELRLNEPNRTTITADMYAAVIRRLEEGELGYKIAEAVGVSPATVSNINKSLRSTRHS